MTNLGESSLGYTIQTVLTSVERPDGAVGILSTSNVWPNVLGLPGVAGPARAKRTQIRVPFIYRTTPTRLAHQLSLFLLTPPA